MRTMFSWGFSLKASILVVSRNLLSSRIEIVDHAMAEIHARQTPAERLQTAWNMWWSARQMLTRLIRSEHDDWTPSQVRDEVNRRMTSEA